MSKEFLLEAEPETKGENITYRFRAIKGGIWKENIYGKAISRRTALGYYDVAGRG